jgi:O-antigen biosynthesis protein
MEFTGERFVPLSKLIDDEIAFEHLHRYHAALELVKGKIVLDIACGEGYGTAILSKNVAKIFGIDIDQASIDHAKKTYKSNNIEFICGSADKIPLPDDSVEVVISYETIEHINEESQKIFLSEIKRVLRKEGILVISTPDKTNYTDRYSHKNEFHIKEFEKDEFIAFLENYFGHVSCFLQGYEIVDAITKDSPDSVTNLSVSNWPRTSKPFARKYVIAVCGDFPMDADQHFSSVVFQVNKNYFDIMDGIVEKEAHILELGSWGKDLDKEIIRKDEIIRRLSEAETKNQEAQNILVRENNKWIEKYEQIQKSLTEKEVIIQEQKERLNDLYIQLDTASKRLNEIYGFHGWKWLNSYNKLRRKLLSKISKKYQSLKKIFRKLRGEKDPVQQISAPEQLQIFDVIEFETFNIPVVSIIIPVYNGWAVTYRCLKSIKENTIATAYEIIIADDGATDETRNIEDYIKNITAIRNERNLGFLNNCNHASGATKGKYILFLNNDTEVKPGWLSSLVELMDRDEHVGMCGSKLIYPNGKLQEAGGIIWNDASGWNFGHSQDPEAPQFNYVKEVDYISGAALMIRKKLWNEIGGFDKQYSPAYYEDTDLAFEVRKRGYKVVYQPLSEVIHFEGFSNGKDQTDTTSIKAYQVINKNKFFEKWKEQLSAEHFPNAENVFWARDKSASKKTILVIDHYVPHFDKDAGSRHTFQYLKLFLDLNLNVKFIGDNFYKHEPYTTNLQQLGIEVLYGEYYRLNWKEWVLENKDKIDYVLLNRPHISIKYIDFLKENTRAKIIFFGHDLHFYREEKQYQVEKTAALQESSKKWKETETCLFEKSDIILTPSKEEQKIISGLSSSFHVSVIPLFYFKNINSPITDFSGRKDLLFVGGFNHAPNVDGILWFMKEVWPTVKERIPGIQLNIAGSNAPESIKNLASADVFVKGYVSDQELETLYKQVRIVVIPLRYGAGTKGKTLEALKNGVPLVTTPEGVEGLPGDISFVRVRNNSEEFAAELVRMYTLADADLAVFSKKEIQYIKHNFHFDVARAAFLDILG